MKTNSAKTNPAFKRAQPLPEMPDLHPPTTGGAGRCFSEFTQPQNDLTSQLTNIIVCAPGISQDFHPPAVRSLN